MKYVRQRKQNKSYITFMWNLKYIYIYIYIYIYRSTSIQNRTKPTDTENKLLIVTRGAREGSVRSLEVTYTHYCI